MFIFTYPIRYSKLIKSEIQKTKELLRNAVSHAPLVNITTEWIEDIQDIYMNTPDQESHPSEVVNIEIEAGPNLPM